MVIEPVVRHPSSGEQPCRPADLLHELLAEGKLPNFVEAFANEQGKEDKLGNCHEVSRKLLEDLVAAGKADDWFIVCGYCTFEGRRIVHSWLQCDRWIIDAARRELLIADGQERATEVKIQYPAMFPFEKLETWREAVDIRYDRPFMFGFF